MVRFMPRSSSSRVMLLLLAVTFVTSAALCVFAWRLAVVDRALREQLASQRLEQAADSGRSAILERIAATGDRLRVVLDAEPAARPALMAQLGEDRPDRTALLFQQRTAHVFPAHALRYLPDTPTASPLPAASFAAGEALEHQRHQRGVWRRTPADVDRR